MTVFFVIFEQLDLILFERDHAIFLLLKAVLSFLAEKQTQISLNHVVKFLFIQQCSRHFITHKINA